MSDVYADLVAVFPMEQTDSHELARMRHYRAAKGLIPWPPTEGTSRIENSGSFVGDTSRPANDQSHRGRLT
jgi:hypothetical protein